MMKKKHKPFLVSIGSEESLYEINNVKYIVSSQFQPLVKENRIFMKNRLEKIVIDGIAPLTENRGSGNMSDRYMCPTASEESKCS